MPPYVVELSIIVGIAISIGVLKKGQSDTRRDVTDMRGSLKEMSKALERLATMAELHEQRLQSHLVAVDELHGDLKRHGREIQELREWRAKMEERFSRGSGMGGGD